MKRVLVIYYSRTGYTRRIAAAVAERCQADLEPIKDRRTRHGWLAYLMSAIEAYRGRGVEILPVAHDPAKYDLLVIGTPVWAGHLSSPVLSFLQAHKGAVKRYASFCTEGGHNGEKVLAQIAAILGQPALAEMVLTDAEIDSGRHEAKLKDYADRLQRLVREAPDAAQ